MQLSEQPRRIQADTSLHDVPLLIFAFNRPMHLRRALESLERNIGADRRRLFIFLDGPRNEQDVTALKAVRKVAEERRWCGSCEILVRQNNLGCARSIIDGVTTLCRESGKVIVLEDDLVLSPWFLEFVQNALDRYAESESIMHVSGYMYPVDLLHPNTALCLPLISPWGWATWWRAWKLFDIEATGYKILCEDADLRKRFDLDDSIRHFHLLESAITGAMDSWAMRWYLTLFMRGALGLFPGRSLVSNTGFDGSGRHCSADHRRPQDQLANLPPQAFPKTVEVNEEALALVRGYLAQRWRTSAVK